MLLAKLTVHGSVLCTNNRCHSASTYTGSGYFIGRVRRTLNFVARGTISRKSKVGLQEAAQYSNDLSLIPLPIAIVFVSLKWVWFSVLYCTNQETQTGTEQECAHGGTAHEATDEAQETIVLTRSC